MSSEYKYRPLRVEHFAKPHQRGAGIQGLLDSLPSILAADCRKRAILWRLSGHVIKCGRGEKVA